METNASSRPPRKTAPGDSNPKPAPISGLHQAIIEAASAHAALMVHDLAAGGRVVFASEAACRCLEVDRETLLTWTPERWDAHCPSGTGLCPPTSGMPPARYETEFRTAAGKRVPVEVALAPLGLPGRNYVLSLARDLRPQRAMEANARRLEMRALELRLERGYKEVYDSLLDAIVLLVTGEDGGLTLTGCNRQATILFGRSEAEVLGQSPETGLPPPLALRVRELARRVGEEGGSVCAAEPLELTAGQCWLELSLVPLRASGGLRRLVLIARDVTAARRAEARIRHQSEYDSLTGLPNRAQLRRRLGALLKEGRPLALLYIDLDNFKEINDTLGHSLGDQMLEEAALRLRGTVPYQDLVARMSGDEFIVAMQRDDGREPVLELTERIRQELAGEYRLGHGKVWGSVSIGVALYPEQARDLDELLSHADQAMYAAKAAGRGAWRCFTEAMRERLHTRARLARDLRSALTERQLAVHYQPIVDLADGRVVKAEALLRWSHPELGAVSPALFIPIAEESGLIGEIGDWVFREAARVAGAWNRRVPASAGPWRVSVNRSPRQFFGQDGVDGWLAHLEAKGIPAAALGVEITEGLLLDDRPEVTRQLDTLRAAGVTVSLDDFGTGYSALSYLKKFRIDYLKIDRSFVMDIATDPGGRAIVESIIAMARRLGMRLVAEGVETARQATILAKAGCHYAQGYLYARPLPEAAFLALVAGEDISTPTL